MKYILIVVLSATLAACGRPTQMNTATATAFKECLDKGWVPQYHSNGARIEFSCVPITKDGEIVTPYIEK